jgi:class 3 adenylate cyclase
MTFSIDLSQQPGRDLLNHLLAERNQHPERAHEIDSRIRQEFERMVAIMALDMCGFTRLTEKFGIIHYLSMIHQMEGAARPAVRDNGGIVIKCEADNLWAVFDAPARALETALDIFRAFDAINMVVPDQRDIYGSIGIGFGGTLLIGKHDLYGPEMNLASKLGEDLAESKEILLTTAAYEALEQDRYICEPASYKIGELDIDCYLYKEKVYRTGKLN